MAVNTRNNIVTNGLVIYLDAANRISYVSGSTTWNDLSGFNNSGSLVNGPTFSSDGGGSIVFDAVNDYGRVISNQVITNDFTFTVWAKRDGNSSTSIGGIFGNHYHTELSGANIYFQNNSTTVTMSAGNGVTRPAHTVTIPRLNTLWNFYVIRYSGTTYQLYFNGILLDSRTAVVVQSLNSNRYGIGIWALSYLPEYYLNGKISQCSSYTRALSQQEIIQNYNATKARFGLL
jgi:hypothetical protein